VAVTTLRIATRGSVLARWQADHVAALLRAVDPQVTVELVIVSTEGDRRLDVPLSTLGGKGVFVKEVQAAVLDGRADVAVHSAKDLPAVTPDGLVIAAVPERADPRDALVGSTLAGLAPGVTVATGSQRRQVQLAAARPDLVFVGLRGNIATRLQRLDEGVADAIVMAVAALERLGLADRMAEVLDPEVMLPQVGQGALAIECRADDDVALAALAPLEHAVSRTCVDAERAFLDELGGDCDLPAGCFVVRAEDGTFDVTGVLADDAGRVHRRPMSVAAGAEAAAARHLARALREAAS